MKKKDVQKSSIEFKEEYPRHMKISELSKYTKTPVTTIRFYLHEGMLPKPLKTASTMAYYTQAHINKLLEIKKMKEQENLPLTTIKEILTKDAGEEAAPEEQNGLLTSTRNEIIKTAVELFREKGYGGVTISDIAAKAKIGKGTFYQYFSNKEALFCECLESIFYDLGKDIPELKSEKDGMKRLEYRGLHFEKYRDNMMDMLNLSRYESYANDCQFKDKRSTVLANFIEPIRTELELVVKQYETPLKNSTLLAYLLMGAIEYAHYYRIIYKRKFIETNKDFNNIFFRPETLERKKRQ